MFWDIEEAKKQLYKNGFIFFIGGVVANILNYFYRVLMGRMLGVEYFGELTAIISLTLILSVPAGPVQIVMARFTAVFGAGNFLSKIKGIFIYLTKLFFAISLFLIIIVLIFSSQISDFLQLSSKSFVYYLIGISIILLLTGLPRGVLQGLERFLPLSLITVLESAGRVSLAVILVAYGFGLRGALIGFLLPSILIYFLALYFIKNIVFFKNSEKEENQFVKKEIWQYFFYSFVVFALLNFLINIDKILVKHYFSAFDAGIFSAFSTLGQAVFILISLLAGVMFPLVATKQSKKENYFSLLKTCVLLSFLIIIIVCALFFLFSNTLLSLFFGTDYIAGAGFLGYYGLIMGLCGLIFLLSFFFMALNKFNFLYFLAAGGLLEVLFIVFWHNNFSQVLLGIFASFLFCLLAIAFLSPWLSQGDKNCID